MECVKCGKDGEIFQDHCLDCAEGIFVACERERFALDLCSVDDEPIIGEQVELYA